MMLIGLGVNAQSTNNITGIVKFVENPQMATIDTTATKLIGRKASDGRIVRYNWGQLAALFQSGGSTPTFQEVITAGSTATTANPIVMNGQGGQISLNNQGVTIISGNGVNTFYVSDTIAKFYSRAQGIPAIHNNELATLGQVNTLVSGQALQPVLSAGSTATVNTDVLINHGTGGTYSNIALEDGSAVIGTLSNNLKVTNTTAVIGSALSVGAPVGEDDAVRVQDLNNQTLQTVTDNGAITDNDISANSLIVYDNAEGDYTVKLYGNDGLNIESLSGRVARFQNTGSGGSMSLIKGSTEAIISSVNITGTHNYNLPDNSGTIALLSDITGGGGTVTSVTGTAGVTVATGTTTPVIGLGDITPTSVAASGTVTGSNLSGNNTGDNATNTTSNTYADGKVQNSLNPSTNIAPSATAVNTALAGKATIGGDATTATMMIGTTNSFNLTLIRNNVNQLNLDGSYIRAFMPFTSATVANGVLSLLTTGVDVTRTQTTGVAFTAGNTNASNTGDLFNVKNSTGVVGGFRSDGRGYGSNAIASNDFVPLGQVQAALIPAYSAKTASYTLTATDYTVTLTSGTATFTLPTAVGITGKIYIVKNKGAGVLTIATTSSQTMDGSTTKTFGTQYGGMAVQSNGTNWDIIGVF